MAAPVDNEGYLVNPEDWTDAHAVQAAAAENIVLGDEHWIIIRFMRAYWEEHQIAPDSRHAIRHLTQETGADRNRLFELFPFGYVQQACKIAGMKRPRAWSTG